MVWGGERGDKVPNIPKFNIQKQLKCLYNMLGCFLVDLDYLKSFDYLKSKC